MDAKHAKPYVLKIRYAPYRGAKVLKCAYSTFPGFDKRWVTRDAAEEAKDKFKKWVDEGMHAQQRAAGAAAAASRAAAPAAA